MLVKVFAWDIHKYPDTDYKAGTYRSLVTNENTVKAKRFKIW